MAISDREVLQLKTTTCRPVFRDILVTISLPGGFLAVSRVLEDTFEADRIGLEGTDHPDQPVEGLGDHQAVGDGEPSKSRREGVPAEDRQETCAEDDQVAKTFQADSKPTVGGKTKGEY